MFGRRNKVYYLVRENWEGGGDLEQESIQAHHFEYPSNFKLKRPLYLSKQIINK